MCSKKVLFIATVDSHIKLFHLPYLRFFANKGYEVHVATNGEGTFKYCNVKHKIPFSRNPFSTNNIKAYKQLKKLLAQENFEIIHCHTPVASAVTRLSAKKARTKGTKVLYTAHGFHFYKGAPKKNWLIYYTMEKFLSKYTDCLITINKEDYNCAKRSFKAKKVEFVHGVGVDLQRFKRLSPEEKIAKKVEKGYNKEDFLVIYAGEFSVDKNHRFLVENFKKMEEEVPNLKLLFAGKGALKEETEELVASLNLQDKIEFLGFVNNIEQLTEICDMAISPSLREGLPLNILENMACGLPVVASKIRGHIDLLKDEEFGFLYEARDVNSMLTALKNAYECVVEGKNVEYKNLDCYGLENVCREYEEIYLGVMGGVGK